RPSHEPRGHAEHCEIAHDREPRLLVERDVLGTVGLKVAKLPAHVDDGAVGSQEPAPEPLALHVRADGDGREMPMNLLGVTLPPGAEPLGNARHRVRDESDERRHHTRTCRRGRREKPTSPPTVARSAPTASANSPPRSTRPTRA